MTKEQTDALNKLLGLKRITYETNTNTRHAQNAVIRSIKIEDLAAIAGELEKHFQQFGW